MKAYIAGKISGDKNYNWKFTRAEDFLSARGYVVISPDILPDGMNPEDYMRMCIHMIESADVIFFLSDWEESEKAKMEWRFCKYIGKKIIYLQNVMI